MLIIPEYVVSYELISLISKIEAYYQLFLSFDIPSLVFERIRRTSLLKSSLFSARIEGNTLNMEELQTTSEVQKKKEIFNIIEAHKFVEKNITKSRPVTIELIQELHHIVLHDLHANAGQLRLEIGAIFNQSGEAVYLSPPPEKIKPLLYELLTYVNSDREKIPLVTAMIAHLAFEKIHPFIDGNGRVGRLLIDMVLRSKGYSFNIPIPFEEFLDDNKTQYYSAIDRGLRNPDNYLFFMLDAFHKQAEKVKDELFVLLKKKETIWLPSRQEEIFQIIKEHKIISFDFLRRRFLKIPPRTLRYDLKKLADAKLIVKIGKTRGSYYAMKAD